MSEVERKACQAQQQQLVRAELSKGQSDKFQLFVSNMLSVRYLHTKSTRPSTACEWQWHNLFLLFVGEINDERLKLMSPNMMM